MTAAGTTPAAAQSTLYRIAGTTTSMFRVIVNVMAGAEIMMMTMAEATVVIMTGDMDTRAMATATATGTDVVSRQFELL
jgi:hypothetical protein